MVFPEIYHIGCLKTGTTSLQKVLSEDDRIHLILYSRFFNTDRWHEGNYSHFIPGKINIESDENILRKYKGMVGLTSSLKRIKQCSPNAKIILTIREQRNMLLSMYKHHIRQTHDSFTPDQFLDSEAGSSFLETLYYAEIYKEVNRFFDSENIYIFLFEALKSDFTNFMESFYRRVFGIDPPAVIKETTENIGLNDAQILWKRKLNSLYLFGESSGMNRVEHAMHQILLRIIYRLTSGNINKRIRWEDFSKHQELEEKFRIDNTALQNLTGINLGKYRYLTQF